MKRERIYACATPGCKNQGITISVEPNWCECGGDLWPLVECMECWAEVPYCEFEWEAA